MFIFYYIEMDTLPREIWLYIFSFIKKEYAHEDESSSEEKEPVGEPLVVKSILQQGINKEYKGWYYSVHILYQTSKVFAWLRKYEFIHVYSDLFWHKVYISDINGSKLEFINTNGRTFINTKKEYVLMGYKIGDKICEHLTDAYYHKRCVGDKRYYDSANCSRWWGDCKGCDNCIQLDIIESQIFAVDQTIERMVRGGETQEVVIREKSMRLRNLDLKYDTTGLELCS